MFLTSEGDDDSTICDVFAFVCRYFRFVFEKHDVGAGNVSNSLSESPKFICITLGPHVFAFLDFIKSLYLSGCAVSLSIMENAV